MEEMEQREGSMSRWPHWSSRLNPLQRSIVKNSKSAICKQTNISGIDPKQRLVQDPASLTSLENAGLAG